MTEQPLDAAASSPPTAPSPGGLPVAVVWPVRHAVALVFSVACLTLVAGRILRWLPRSSLDSTSTALVILATFMTAYAIELGIVWIVARRAGVGFAESVGLRRVPHLAGWLAIAVASAVGLRVVATAYSGVMVGMRWLLPGWDSNPMKYFPRTTLGSVAVVLIVVVGAPLVEETIFRGVLLPSLEGRFGVHWAVGITTVVFTAMHLNLFSFAPVLLVGWVLAALFVRSRSLWVPIACHSVFNGIGVLVVLMLRGNGVV